MERVYIHRVLGASLYLLNWPLPLLSRPDIGRPKLEIPVQEGPKPPSPRTDLAADLPGYREVLPAESDKRHQWAHGL